MKTRLIPLLEKFQDQNMVINYEGKVRISPITMFGFNYYVMDNSIRIGQFSLFFSDIHKILTDEDETYILLCLNDGSYLSFTQEEDIYEDQ